MDEAIVYFEPDEASTFPFTTRVEYMLGGVGRAMYPDGSLQFRDDDDEPSFIYSPQLQPIDLEDFCKTNLPFYEAFYDAHAEQLENCERIQMEKFW